jgi:hypothetical protein
LILWYVHGCVGVYFANCSTGLIFTFEAIYIVYQLLPSQRERLFHASIAGWVCIAFVLQSTWLFCWPLGGFFVSILPIGGALYSFHRVVTHLESVKQDFGWTEYVCARVGFSLNLSWLIVANLANLTIVLNHEGYSATADWAVAWLLCATLLCVRVLFTRFDIPYWGTFCWALLGVASKQKHNFVSVASWCYGLLGFLVVCFVLTLLLRRVGVLPINEPNDKLDHGHMPIEPLADAFGAPQSM